MTLLLLTIFFTSFFYYLPKWETFELLCSSSASIATTTQGLFRIVMWTTIRDFLIQLWKHGEHFIMQFDERSAEGQAMLRYGHILEKLMKALVATFGVMAVFANLQPFVMYCFTGKLVLQLNTPIPGINFSAHPGYEMNFIYLVLATIFILQFFVYTHSVLMFLFISICMQVEVLQIKLREFDVLIQNQAMAKASESRKNQEVLQKEFSGLIEAHNECLAFIDDCESFLWLQFMVDMTGFTVQSVVTLFSATKVNWVPGYVVLAGAIFLVFTDCCLATFVEIKVSTLSAIFW